MELELYLMELEDKCEKAIQHYKFEISKISTGRANPQLIKGIKVNYYDSLTPLEEISNISVPEPQQLLIKPYDLLSVKEIYKAIEKANLGIQPVDEGNQVRLSFPTLTTQKRKEYVKVLKELTEEARIGIRNARQSINKIVKDNKEISEDTQKMYLDKIQKNIDSQMGKIDKIFDEKENDLMNN
ncbi:ribosome recycling factor [Mycoplasma leonicaptivi]|uniref:ribosome recycling factor n=1 Tax=Mycoplasma leonicaptivi TaxID=36742 RepID=UPI00048770B5|nr:ribosome recycling factor [Mycoplasma leonicaptivi]